MQALKSPVEPSTLILNQTAETSSKIKIGKSGSGKPQVTNRRYHKKRPQIACKELQPSKEL